MHNNQLYACQILEAQSSSTRNYCENMVTNICFSSKIINYLISRSRGDELSLGAGICLLSRVLACDVTLPFVLTGIA